MTDLRKGFLQGYALAICELVRLHDMPTVAKDIIQCCGFTLVDFEEAQCDTYDLEIIYKIFSR